MALPYPGMNFVPLDVLTAAEQNQLVANIEYLDGNIQTNDTIYSTTRRRIFIDGSAGDDSNTGLTTSSPKKTLAGAFSVINSLGGSADIRFLTAGTYDLGVSYFDGANFVFEKHSTGIGDVKINLTGLCQFENSVIAFNTIELMGSEARFYNSYATFQADSIITSQVVGYGSTLILTRCIVRNVVGIRDGSCMTLNNLTFAPYPSLTSGSLISAQNCSKMTVLPTNFVVESPDNSATLNLFYSESSEIVFNSGATFTDSQTGTKFNRPIYTYRSTVFHIPSIKTALESLTQQTGYYSHTVQVLGSATLGS